MILKTEVVEVSGMDIDSDLIDYCSLIQESGNKVMESVSLLKKLDSNT